MLTTSDPAYIELGYPYLVVVNADYAYLLYYGTNTKIGEYNLTTKEYRLIEMDSSYTISGDERRTNYFTTDELNGTTYIRSDLMDTIAFKYAGDNLSSYATNSAIIMQDLSGLKLTKIQNSANLYIGVKDVFVVKENQQNEKYLDGNYLTYWGDGTNWHVLKNPNHETCTVTFNSDGGSAIASQTIEIGTSVIEPTSPTKANSEFKQWELNGEKFYFGSLVPKSITLNATWYTL